MDVAESREDQQRERREIGDRLLTALQNRSAVSVADLEQLAAELKASYPDMADLVDQIVAPTIARMERLPERAAALYFLSTEERPEIVEGEVVGGQPDE